MDIQIGEELFFPKDIHCFKENTYKSNINCQYWSIDNDSCVTKCSLNVINNPSREDCSKCPKRLSWKGKKIIRLDDVTGNIKVISLEDSEKEPQQNEIPNPIRPEFQKQFEEEVKKTFIEKTKSYVKAEGSQALQGKVSEEIFERRKQICMSCEFRVNDRNGNKDSIGWCKGGCGCSIGNPRAALSQKLYMPTVSCPKGKFGVEHGEGFNIKDAKDSAKGLLTSIKNIFKKD
jgi:hypothetical protein